jgi:hypothetical protein
MSAAELAAARAERAARYAAQQADAAAAVPPPPPQPPADAARTAESTSSASAPPGDDVHPVLACIELSGERDRQGTHKATEVDCRLWENAWRPLAAGSRVFTLNHGEGKLHDTRAETDEARTRNMRFLSESARLIQQARSRGESVWVHCTEVRACARAPRASRRAPHAAARADVTGAARPGHQPRPRWPAGVPADLHGRAQPARRVPHRQARARQSAHAQQHVRHRVGAHLPQRGQAAEDGLSWRRSSTHTHLNAPHTYSSVRLRRCPSTVVSPCCTRQEHPSSRPRQPQPCPPGR